MDKKIKQLAEDILQEFSSSYSEADQNFLERMIHDAWRIEQVEGEWVWISDDDVMCTTCGRVFNSNDNADAGLSSWRFCPNCGAKMKGE